MYTAPTMHIVLLHDDALPSARGGAAVVVERLRKAYKSRGHTVTLVTTHKDPAKGSIVRENSTISILSVYPPSKRHRRSLGDSVMRTALTKIFADLKPDAVHAHNVHADLTYESLLIARRHTAHIVLTAHDVFLVAFRRVSGPRFERLSLEGKPIRMHWWEHLLAVGRKYWPLRNIVIRRILSQSGAKVIAISEAHRHFLEANGIVVAAVIHNGTEILPPVPDEAARAFRLRHGLTGPTILFGGRIGDDKGSSALFAAFHRVRSVRPSVQLLIAGDLGRIRQSLETVTPEDRAAIILAGWLSPDDMRIAYSAATLVTTPSLCFDPFNLMNIEAMAEGKPVVATCFGGAPELLVHGTTGRIVQPRDAAAFAKALLDLLTNPALCRTMGESGRSRVQELFSIQKQCDAYLRLFLGE